MTGTVNVSMDLHAGRHAPGGPDSLSSYFTTPAAVDAKIAALNLGTAATHAATDFEAAGTATSLVNIAVGNIPAGAPAGTPSLRAIGSTATTVVAGNDARLTNARTPTAHASTHQTGGADVVHETYTSIASASTAATIDASTFDTWAVNLTAANCTLTITGAPSSGSVGRVRLIMVQDSTGSRLATWPASVKWLAGVPPTLSTAGGSITVIEAFTYNAGTTWYASVPGSSTSAQAITLVAVTNLNAVASSATAVNLSWDDTSVGVTDYLVQYRTTTGPGSWQTFAHTASAGKTIVVTGLTTSTSYDFQVAAVSGGSTGPFGPIDSATPAATAVVTETFPTNGSSWGANWTTVADNGSGAGTVDVTAGQGRLIPPASAFATGPSAALTAMTTPLSDCSLTLDIGFTGAGAQQYAAIAICDSDGGLVNNPGPQNAYFVRLIPGANVIRLMKSVANSYTSLLGDVSFTFVTGTRYSIDFTRIGNVLNVYLWALGTSKPGSPTVTYTDNASPLGAGIVSLSVTNGPATTAYGCTFDNVSVSAPVVTNNPSGGPLGVGGTWNKFFEDLFPGTTLSSTWVPNRWAGTLPTNESTNNPSLQLETSYSGNVVVNNGLKMLYSAQVDPSLAGSWPYCGAHVSAYQLWLTTNSFMEVVMRVNNLGAEWIGLAMYVTDGSGGGEIDWAEFGDTWDTKAPTCNIHDTNYTQQDQATYTGSPALAGDGLFHVYGIKRAGNVVTFYLDGVQCSYPRTLYAGSTGTYGLFFEGGVYKNSSLGNAAIKTFGSGLDVSRVTVWH